MNRPDVIRQPLGVVAATFVIMMACVVIRVTTAPYPAETDLAADMPLGRAIDSRFPTGAAACTVGLVAAILNATLLAGMIVRYSVSAVRTYLPMAVYAMTAYGICFPAGSVSATLVPLLLILGSTQMIAAFKRSYQFEHVFKSAFCIGLLPMLYAPALPLVLIVPVTLVLYRRTLREAVVAAAGLLLPFFICSVVWWGLGDSFGLMGHELLAGTTLGEDTALPAFFGEKGVWSKVYIGLFAALTLCSAIIILRTLSSLRTRAKKIHIHFLWLLLLCLISLLLPGNTIASLGVLAVPCCVTVSAFFIRYRGWLPLAIYTVLTALMLYINLFPGV